MCCWCVGKKCSMICVCVCVCVCLHNNLYIWMYNTENFYICSHLFTCYQYKPDELTVVHNLKKMLTNDWVSVTRK